LTQSSIIHKLEGVVAEGAYGYKRLHATILQVKVVYLFQAGQYLQKDVKCFYRIKVCRTLTATSYKPKAKSVPPHQKMHHICEGQSHLLALEL